MRWVRAVILALGVCAGVYLLALRTMTVVQPVNPDASGQVVQARVVRFGTIPSKWRAHQVIVVASTPNGRTGQGVIALARLNERDCKVGAPVSAHMEGSVLVADALTCGDRQ